MHIHISTGMMLVSSVAILGTVGLCMWRGASKRRAAQEERDSQRAHEERMERVKQGVWEPRGYGAINPQTRPQPTPVYNNTPTPPVYDNTYRTAAAAPTPVVNNYHNDGFGGSGFLTGMLMGEVLSGGNRGTTIIEEGGGHVVHDGGSSYVDNGSFDSSSHDSGFTFDSGSSVSDSSGGFDVSIGC